jgi:hypothetical protein
VVHLRNHRDIEIYGGVDVKFCTFSSSALHFVLDAKRNVSSCAVSGELSHIDRPLKMGLLSELAKF